MITERRLPGYVRSYQNPLRPLCQGATTKGFGCTRHATMEIENGRSSGLFCMTHFYVAKDHVNGFARLPVNGKGSG